MIIDEMGERECAAILEQVSTGRLGCALDAQPYVVPVHFVYDSGYLYILSTFGQKIEWMRTNPRICLQADQITSDSDWSSVVITGSYEELTEPRFSEEREHARDLLQKRNRWWQTAFAERQTRQDGQLIDPIFFRVKIASITGLRAHSE